MNIDDMTYGQLKQIAAMVSTNAVASNIASPVLGKYCIARCYSAGVHAGVVSAVDGENVVLYAWYDNEFGYTKQVIRLAKHVAKVRRAIYY